MSTALFFDQRSQLVDQPAVHALIVGVSAYTNLPRTSREFTKTPDLMHRYLDKGLGLLQLKSAASNALALGGWLVENQSRWTVPLGSVRLLVAPSDTEMPAFRATESRTIIPDLNSFLKAALDWRLDAATHRENIALFYFSGHGFQSTRRGDHVLLLQDFGDDLGTKLKNAVDTTSLWVGMARTSRFKQMATTQLFFVDACRVGMRPSEDEVPRATDVFETPRVEEDDRVAPVFFTAQPGYRAWGHAGRSLFLQALLSCLNDSAEERDGRWWVTTLSLLSGLEHHLTRISRLAKVHQTHEVQSFSKNLELLRVLNTPMVEVEIRLVPPELAVSSGLSITGDAIDTQAFGPPVVPHPYSVTLPAGAYQVSLAFESGASFARLKSVRPPREEWSFATQDE